MTIASEITRLQWAKSDTRTSIINKGVDVPASAKLDTYHNYIDLIDTGSIDGIFVPASFTIQNAISNSYWASIKADLWDTNTSNNQKYIHYFWVTDPNSSAYNSYYVYAWVKTVWNNPTITKLSWYDDDNTRQHSRYMNVMIRMKRSGASSIMASSLIRDAYYPSGSWSWTNVNWKCINITDTTSSIVNLWDTIERDPTAEILSAWTTSCGITEEESILSLWKTTMSITWPLWNDYNVVATLNI